jgi:hypothetical protein
MEHAAGRLARSEAALLAVMSYNTTRHTRRAQDHRARVRPSDIGTGGQRMANEGFDIVYVQIKMRSATDIDSLDPQVPRT